METLNRTFGSFNSSSADGNNTGTDAGDCPNFADFSDSSDFNSDASAYVEFICYPLLLLICTVGNGLSLLTFGSKRYASSVTIYLLALAVSDLGVLWCYLHTYLVDVKAFHAEEVDPVFRENALRTRVFNWLRDVCLQVSDWSLIAFSVERLCVIISPFTFKNGLSWKTGLYVELVITFLAALFCLETLVSQYHLIARRPFFPRGTPMMVVVGSGIVKWHTMQNEAEVIMIFLKWGILAACNTSLIIMIKKRTMSAPRAFVSAANQNSIQKSHAVLIGAIVLYLVTNAPMLVLKCLVRASKPPYCSFFVTNALIQQMMPVANIILLCNYSLNFVMYCLVSRQFRGLLKERCFWLEQWMKKLKPGADSTASMVESSSDMHLTPVDTMQVIMESAMPPRRSPEEDPSPVPVRRHSLRSILSSDRRPSLLDRTDSTDSCGAIEFHAKAT